MTALVSTSVIEAIECEHKLDLGAAYAEIATLRKQLLDSGIEPITKSGEAWLMLFQQACQVMRTAQLALLDLGTSKEMLEEWT